MEKDRMENQEIAEPYRVVLEGGRGELTEKKSRFIATVRPVESEEEAAAFIEEMKKAYWDASHNCSAFVIGKKAELTRCSDDGEPARTAGRPMLEVLLGENIRNAASIFWDRQALRRRKSAIPTGYGSRYFCPGKRRKHLKNRWWKPPTAGRF